MSGKYRVHWTNFSYYAEDEFDHLDDTVKYVNSKAFEASIMHNGKIVASKTTFSGWAVRDRELVPRTPSEIKVGDTILVGKDFHTVAYILGNEGGHVFVEFEGGGDVILDGLVFTKG